MTAAWGPSSQPVNVDRVPCAGAAAAQAQGGRRGGSGGGSGSLAGAGDAGPSIQQGARQPAPAPAPAPTVAAQSLEGAAPAPAPDRAAAAAVQLNVSRSQLFLPPGRTAFDWSYAGYRGEGQKQLPHPAPSLANACGPGCRQQASITTQAPHDSSCPLRLPPACLPDGDVVLPAPTAPARYDAQADFGAKGDGQADDTAALQVLGPARPHGLGRFWLLAACSLLSLCTRRFSNPCLLRLPPLASNLAGGGHGCQHAAWRDPAGGGDVPPVAPPGHHTQRRGAARRWGEQGRAWRALHMHYFGRRWSLRILWNDGPLFLPPALRQEGETRIVIDRSLADVYNATWTLDGSGALPHPAGPSHAPIPSCLPAHAPAARAAPSAPDLTSASQSHAGTLKALWANGGAFLQFM